MVIAMVYFFGNCGNTFTIKWLFFGENLITINDGNEILKSF